MPVDGDPVRLVGQFGLTTAFRKVVLPDPFGPTMAVSSPGFTEKSTPEMIWLPPIETEMSRASIMGASQVKNAATAQQYPQEERGADDGRDDADRQFRGGDDGATDGVGEQEHAGAEQC
jgi:hypothetical protein